MCEWGCSSDWTVCRTLPLRHLFDRTHVGCCLTRASRGGGLRGSVTLVGIDGLWVSVTVTEVPPGFPLQTHFSLFRFVLFLSLLLSLFLSRRTHVFVFCLFSFGWSVLTLPKLHMPPFPLAPSPLRSLLTCELFQWNIFEFSFISTWLLNLFSCCLYIILLLLWFLKFHLYYILGPRDHPDIVDSFMQLQAQVCFCFLFHSLWVSLSLFLSFSVLSSLLFLSFWVTDRQGGGMKHEGSVWHRVESNTWILTVTSPQTLQNHTETLVKEQVPSKPETQLITQELHLFRGF